MSDLMTAAAARILLAEDPASSFAPTDKDLERIAQIAGRDIPADRLFIVPYTISSSDLDEHYSWFDRSSAENFVADALAPRGMPFLEGHISSRSPFGRVHDSWLTVAPGEPPRAHSSGGLRLARQEPIERIMVARRAYVLRDHEVNGEANAERIKRIEDGIEQDTSVGAMLGAGSRMTCDVCGSSYWSCEHMAGVSYERELEEGEAEEVVATVRLSGARSIEDSLVYAGSNPASAIMRAFQIGKAERLHAEKRLTDKQVRSIEDRYQTRILDSRRFIDMGGVPVDPPSRSSTNTQLPSSGDAGDPTSDGYSKEAQMPKDTNQPSWDGEDAGRELAKLLGEERAASISLYDAEDPVRGALELLLDESRELREEVEDARTQHARQIERIREALGIAEGEKTMEGISRLMAYADLGKTARESVFRTYLESEVRVQGEDAPDEQELRVLTARWSVEQLVAATDRNEKLARQIFKPGSQTKPSVDGPKDGDATEGRHATSGVDARSYA